MTDDKSNPSGSGEVSRRRMLQRLGLAAGVAYAAPVLTGLNSGRASSFSSASFSSMPRARRQTRRQPAPRPEIVVTAPDAAAIELIQAQGYGLLGMDRLEVINAQVARFSLPANRTLEEARTEILQIAPAAQLDPNHVYRPGELACGEDGCAAFEMVGWWPASLSCPQGATIGMIDTGVNTDHEALAGVEVEHSAMAGPERRQSSQVHGTAIAVLLAGRADTRTPGLLSGARLVAVDAFHADAAGQDAADAFDIARALDRLAASEARVVNLSFAGPANLVLQSVVRALLDRDVTLVAAAGNAGPNAEPLFPAAYEGVVAVTAVDHRLSAWRQAAAGDHIDFAAPGVRLWTAASVSGGRFRSGTSYAAPFVSAALAAIRAAEPSATGPQTVERLAEGVVDLGAAGRDGTFGWGLVQAPETCAAPDGRLFPADGN